MAEGSDELSVEARKTIANADRMGVASISLIEVCMLAVKERVALTVPIREWLIRATDNAGIEILPITTGVAIDAFNLPGLFHKDPVDRQIVATARVYGADLITKDQRIREYPHVDTIW
jgi:PIN domain nuclease of toxin-antitoxin system